jgi:hypothetical protein
MNPCSRRGAERRAEEEAQREQRCHAEVYVTGTIIAECTEQADRRQQHRKRRPLRQVLREPECVNEERDEDLTATDPEQTADDAG